MPSLDSCDMFFLFFAFLFFLHPRAVFHTKIDAELREILFLYRINYYNAESPDI